MIRPAPTLDDWRILKKHGVTPDNLHVGWLYLPHTSITALPDNLHVSGWISLSFTPITALPDDLYVGGMLFLRGTKIKPLLTDARGYRLDRAGDRYIAGCRNFSAEEALAHWGGETYPDRARGDRYVAAIKAEENRRAAQ